MMTPREALALAIQLHANQKDKAGRPYWEHCQRVQAKLIEWNVPSSLLIAAALHDVLEDTGVSGLELIEAGVPRAALDLIKRMTKAQGEDYDAYIQRIRDEPDVATIKLADLADNLDPLRLMQLKPAMRKQLYHKYNSALRVLLDIGACCVSPTEDGKIKLESVCAEVGRLKALPNAPSEPLDIKARAHMIDPDCWVSYSGKPKEFKQAIDKRRSAALAQAMKETP